MFDLTKILEIVRTATQVTPEFVALVDAMSDLAKPKEQAALQDALASARARSDGLHAQVQAEAAEAA
jgi:hypothetical protein